MTGFPILNLPLIPRQQVLKQVAISDLLILSFCSRRIRKQVIAANIRIDEMDCYQLKSGDLEIKVNKFKIRMMEMREDPKSGYVGVYLLTGDNFQNFRFIIQFSFQSLRTAMCYYRKHVLSTFRNVTNFSCDLDSEEELATNPILRYHRNFYNLTVSGSGLNAPKKTRGLAKEDFDLIFELLTVRNELTLFPLLSGQYQFYEGFKSKKVNVKFAKWVTMDAVINSRSSEIGITWSRVPPAAQLKAFLKAWISKKKMENLELFTLDLALEEFTDSYFLDVFNGIPYERITSVRVKIQRVDGTHAMVRIAYHSQFFLKVIK